MKEAFLILLVIAVLLALTALRYRKQIAGVIGVARMLKQARQTVANGQRNLPHDGGQSVPLVHCEKCGIWVPQNKALKIRDRSYCSDACFVAAKAS